MSKHYVLKSTHYLFLDQNINKSQFLSEMVIFTAIKNHVYCIVDDSTVSSIMSGLETRSLRLNTLGTT